MVTICTTSFNIKKRTPHILQTERIYVYCMDLKASVLCFSILDWFL